MKLRFPIYAQILTFLALHLAVLLGLVFFFFNAQFGPGWEPFVYSPFGERVDAVAGVIGRQIQGRPVSSWNSVLDEFGKLYGVNFAIFDHGGHQLAGQALTLPPAVLARVTARRLPPPLPEPLANVVTNPEKLLRDRPSHRGGRFLLHTTNPDRFWIGARLHLLPPIDGVGPPMLPACMSAEMKNVQLPDQSKLKLVAAAVPSVRPPPPAILVATSSNLWQTKLFLDWHLLAAATLGFALLSFAIWWPFVYRINKAVSQLTVATEKIALGKFETTVRLGAWDEIGRLSEAINRMSARLHRFVTGQKRFLGDIAHELCSPVARLQVALELLERSATPQQEEALRDIREEAEEISALINELLAFSKAGLRPKEMALHAVDLKPLIEGEVKKLCPEGLVELDIQADGPVLGDEVLLSRAIGNILRNAVRYAGACGPITVRTAAKDGAVRLTVKDSGPGVPPEAIDSLGEPFYRPEESRSRSSGGVGLGLAIVKTCVQACDGSFKVSNAQPKGLEVEITLQAAASPIAV